VCGLTPGAPSPAGLELDGPGARWAPPAGKERLMKLPPMRARASDQAIGRHRTRVHLHRKLLAKSNGCPRAQAAQAAHPALDVRRS
jgi:hypothetical protein